MTKQKLVPVEPTEEMMIAGNKQIGSPYAFERTVKGIYKAMLSAAPALANETAPMLANKRGEAVAWLDRDNKLIVREGYEAEISFVGDNCPTQEGWTELHTAPTPEQRTAAQEKGEQPVDSTFRQTNPSTVNSGIPAAVVPALTVDSTVNSIDLLCKRLLGYAQEGCELESSKTLWAIEVEKLCALAKIGRAALDAEPIHWEIKPSGEDKFPWVTFSAEDAGFYATRDYKVTGLIPKPEVK